MRISYLLLIENTQLIITNKMNIGYEAYRYCLKYFMGQTNDENSKRLRQN